MALENWFLEKTLKIFGNFRIICKEIKGQIPTSGECPHHVLVHKVFATISTTLNMEFYFFFQMSTVLKTLKKWDDAIPEIRCPNEVMIATA